MKCPHCGVRLLQKSEDKVKLRAPILIFSADGDHCVIPCPKCREEVEIPVTLSKAAIQDADSPPLLLSRRLTK